MEVRKYTQGAGHQHLARSFGHAGALDFVVAFRIRRFVGYVANGAVGQLNVVRVGKR